MSFVYCEVEMSESEEIFDGILLNLMKQHKNDVPDFLCTMARFLSRKTDFFTGFEDDEWEKLLLNAFRGEASKSKDKESEAAEKRRQEVLKKNQEQQETSEDVEFKIFVKMIDGETNSLFVKSTYELSKVLQLIEATLDEDEDMEVCRISYGGRPLRTDQTLGHYNVKAESTLFLNGRLCGGSGIDESKLFRLLNLFVFVIRGQANHGALSNQLNKLMCCETKADLKDYDHQYIMHELQ